MADENVVSVDGREEHPELAVEEQLTDRFAYPPYIGGADDDDDDDDEGDDGHDDTGQDDDNLSNQDPDSDD